MANAKYESNGNNILKLREKLGLSQAKFAELLGVTERMVSNYETGTSTLPIDKAIILSKECNCSLDWIYNVGEQKSTKERIANYTEEECMKFLVDIRDFITCSDGQIYLTIKNNYWKYIKEINEINNSARAKSEKKREIARLNGKYKETQDDNLLWTFSVDEKEFFSELQMPTGDRVGYATELNQEFKKLKEEQIEEAKAFIKLISDTSYMASE